MTRDSRAVFVCLGLLGLSVNCGSPADPSEPATTTKVVVEAATPSSGTVVIPSSYVYNEIGGVVLPPQSGLMATRVTLSTATALAFAQVNVYLVTAAGTAEYCGQNSPDSPTWRSLPAGWSTTVTITGFQVYRAPCTVTGVRVMLHTRDDVHVGPPPTAAETIAEATMPVNFQIRLQSQVP